MTANIIKVSQDYRDRLYLYLMQLRPRFGEKYVTFCVEEACHGDNPQSILAVNDKDEIVGCHLFFETSARIKGEEKEIVWGHDTYLDEGYRHDIGLDFMLEVSGVGNMLGYGLSDVNRKIQKRIPSIVFVEGMLKYFKFTAWGVWGGTKKYLRCSHIPNRLPSIIRTKGASFAICDNSTQLDIPNKGYWNKDVQDIEFVRDEEYMNKRFFNSPVHKYYIYTSQEKDCYFVVRPILFHGIQALFLVDFRYDMRQKDRIFDILDGVEKICRKLHIGIMLTTTNDVNVRSRYGKSVLCKTKNVDFIANIATGITAHDTLLVTAADSDGEYHK